MTKNVTPKDKYYRKLLKSYKGHITTPGFHKDKVLHLRIGGQLFFREFL